jgi:hypothetical protein
MHKLRSDHGVNIDSTLTENIPKDAIGNGSFRSKLKARREQSWQSTEAMTSGAPELRTSDKNQVFARHIVDTLRGKPLTNGVQGI